MGWVVQSFFSKMNSHKNCLQGKTPHSQVNKKRRSQCQHLRNMNKVCNSVNEHLSCLQQFPPLSSVFPFLYCHIYVQGGYLIGKLHFFTFYPYPNIFLLLSVLKFSLTAVGTVSDQCFLFFFKPSQTCLPFLPVISTGIIDRAVTPIHSFGMFNNAHVVCGTDSCNCKHRKPQWVTCI